MIAIAIGHAGICICRSSSRHFKSLVQGCQVADTSTEKMASNQDQPITTKKDLVSQTDPFLQFKETIKVARREAPDPDTEFSANIMVLATCTKDGCPSARQLVLKDFDDRGPTFASNRNSRKGRELLENPKAAIAINWGWINKGVRIEGDVKQLSYEESKECFNKSNSYDSKFVIAVSPQSEVIENRRVLEEKIRKLKEDYPEGSSKVLPYPEDQVTYLLVPRSFEFWTAHTDYFTDRFLYTKNESGSWKLERLAP